MGGRHILVLLGGLGLAWCLSCQSPAAPVATPTLAPTAVPAPAPPPTSPARPTSAPTATVQPTRPPLRTPTAPPALRAARTLRVAVSFDTYETEETVQAELSAVRGILSLVVTQLEVNATYDPAQVSQDEILRVLRNNPEVKLRGEPEEEEEE